jgi:hypothetical protein
MAEQDRRRIAELSADAVGNDDSYVLIRGLEPQLGRDLIPGDDLGAIALAMRSTRARHSASCSAEGWAARSGSELIHLLKGTEVAGYSNRA